MIDIKTNQPGQVKVVEDAVVVIAGTAALEAEGVAGLSGRIADGAPGKRGRRYLAKGVSLTADDGRLRITVEIVVKAGQKLQDVSRDVQNRIKNAIEVMLGLPVEEINVSVSSAVSAVESKRPV